MGIPGYRAGGLSFGERKSAKRRNFNTLATMLPFAPPAALPFLQYKNIL
jgi:hypothetical protein